MDYQKAYCVLFNAMSDAIDQFNRSKIVTQELDEGVNILKKAQETTEKMYIDEE